jgi:hypothetical protein
VRNDSLAKWDYKDIDAQLIDFNESKAVFFAYRFRLGYAVLGM